MQEQQLGEVGEDVWWDGGDAVVAQMPGWEGRRGLEWKGGGGIKEAAMKEVRSIRASLLLTGTGWWAEGWRGRP